MKNLKRALAVLVVVTMMISTVAFASFSDVKDGTSVANAVNVGVGLNLFKGYEDGSFKPEGDITRAEFAAIVVRALGQEAQAAGSASATSFTDVKADHWAAGYINIVTRLGIVNGYGDGTFGPEDKVLYEQAIKMIVVALGYTPAVGAAGYPVGYLTKAGELGITSGVAGSNGVAANRGTVAQLIFNALDVPLMVQTGYGTNLDYVAQDGVGTDAVRKTIMSEYLDVVKLKVSVNSSSITTKKEIVKTTIKNSYKSKYGKVLGDNLYVGKNLDIALGTTDIASLVGANAIVYISYDDANPNDSVAVFAAKDTTNTDEVSLTSDQDVTVAVSTTAGSTLNVATVSYMVNENDRKATTFTVKSDAKLYVNGEEEPNGTDNAELKALLDGTSTTSFYGDASFSLINDVVTGQSYDYDTVFVTNYKNFVVEKVNTTTTRISSKNAAGTITYDPTDTNIKATLFDAKGVAMKWTDLKEYDVLSVKISKSGTTDITVAKVLDNKITGKVLGKDTVNDKFDIAGKEYKVSKTSLMSDIRLGDEGTFFLDQFGRIAYYKIDAAGSSNYAYIVGVSPSSTSFTDGVEMKLFNAKGEMIIASTASKVKLDGITIDSKNLVTPAVADNAATTDVNEAKPATLATSVAVTTNATDTASYVKENGSAWYTIATTITAIKGLAGNDGIGNLITYTTNSSNEITAIDRAYAITSPKSDYKSYFTSFNSDATSAKYDLSGNALVPNAGSRVYITDSTIIMVAPNGTDGKPSTDSDLYELFNVKTLEDEQNLAAVSFYNVDENKNVGCVVVKNTPAIGGSTNGFAVANGVSSSQNAAGDDISKVTVFKDGKSDVLVTATTIASAQIPTSKGPAYTVLKNAKGEVTSFVKLTNLVSTGTITVTDTVTGANTDAGNADKTRYFYGKVKEINGSNVALYTNSTFTDVNSGATIDGGEFSVPGTANVYVYDDRANTSNMVALSDIAVVDATYVPAVAAVGTTPAVAEKTTYSDSAKDDIKNVSIFAREYDGKIVDVIIYIFKK